MKSKYDISWLRGLIAEDKVACEKCVKKFVEAGFGSLTEDEVKSYAVKMMEGCGIPIFTDNRDNIAIEAFFYLIKNNLPIPKPNPPTKPQPPKYFYADSSEEKKMKRTADIGTATLRDTNEQVSIIDYEETFLDFLPGSGENVTSDIRYLIRDKNNQTRWVLRKALRTILTEGKLKVKADDRKITIIVNQTGNIFTIERVEGLDATEWRKIVPHLLHELDPDVQNVELVDPSKPRL